MHARKNLSREQRAERQAERMEKMLNLTPEQKKAIYTANLEAARKMEPEAARNREAMRAIHREKEAQYKATLTPEQYSRYEQAKAERRKKMADHPHRLKKS